MEEKKFLLPRISRKRPPIMSNMEYLRMEIRVRKSFKYMLKLSKTMSQGIASAKAVAYADKLRIIDNVLHGDSLECDLKVKAALRDRRLAREGIIKLYDEDGLEIEDDDYGDDSDFNLDDYDLSFLDNFDFEA